MKAFAASHGQFSVKKPLLTKSQSLEKVDKQKLYELLLSTPNDPLNLFYIDSNSHLDSLWNPSDIQNDILYTCEVRSQNHFSLNPILLFHKKSYECNLKPLKFPLKSNGDSSNDFQEIIDSSLLDSNHQSNEPYEIINASTIAISLTNHGSTGNMTSYKDIFIESINNSSSVLRVYTNDTYSDEVNQSSSQTKISGPTNDTNLDNFNFISTKIFIFIILLVFGYIVKRIFDLKVYDNKRSTTQEKSFFPVLTTVVRPFCTASGTRGNNVDPTPITPGSATAVSAIVIDAQQCRPIMTHIVSPWMQTVDTLNSDATITAVQTVSKTRQRGRSKDPRKNIQPSSSSSSSSSSVVHEGDCLDNDKTNNINTTTTPATSTQRRKPSSKSRGRERIHRSSHEPVQQNNISEQHSLNIASDDSASVLTPMTVTAAEKSNNNNPSQQRIRMKSKTRVTSKNRTNTNNTIVSNTKEKDTVIMNDDDGYDDGDGSSAMMDSFSLLTSSNTMTPRVKAATADNRPSTQSSTKRK